MQDIELVSVLHTAPANGVPSSADYVDGDLEKVTDLATIVAFINGTLLPMLNSLASSASSGLLGTGIYTDTSAQDALVFNAATGNPLTIADSLRSLNGMIQAAQTQVTNLSQQVASLQARLSSSNQAPSPPRTHISRARGRGPAEVPPPFPTPVRPGRPVSTRTDRPLLPVRPG
jgi:hypothetical protein